VLKFKVTSKHIRQNAVEAVSKLTSEPIMEVIIQEWKEDKTASQRGFWHILIGIMAEELGYTKAQLKVILKDEILGTEQVEYKGKIKDISASSEDEKKAGYSFLIEQTYVIAAEQGIVLPEAGYRA
jgi:hypothetical protein